MSTDKIVTAFDLDEQMIELFESCQDGFLSLLVEPVGATNGMHYKYVFILGGVKFFIHHNPPKNRQGVRVRYGASALIAKAVGLEKGTRKTAFEIYQLSCEKLRLFEKTLFDKVSSCVERLGLSSGVFLGESCYDYASRNACATLIDARNWLGGRAGEVPG